MKSSPLVIIVPFIIALLVVGSVIAVRYFSPVPQESQAVANPTPATFPSLIVPSGKPEVGFEQMQPIAPVSDLRQAFEDASDPGTSELDAVKQEASSL